MLSFLLDEHLSPSIAVAVKATRPTITIQTEDRDDRFVFLRAQS